MTANTRLAAVDISTGQAIESYLSSKVPRDPWAEKCFTNFVDLIINHDKVYYAHPNMGSEPGSFPSTFNEAEVHGLLDRIPEVAADSVTLAPYDIRTAYLNFQRWAEQHRFELKKWLEFCQHTLNLRTSYENDKDIILYRTIKDDFWWTHRRPEGWLRTEESNRYLSEDNKIFAFNIFLRAVQYHYIFKDKGTYFPHPLRTGADLIETFETVSESQEQWSWGRYFVWYLERQERREWNAKDILVKVKNVEEKTKERKATWYDLTGTPSTEKAEIIMDIAASLGLPGIKRRRDTLVGYTVDLFTALVSIAVDEAIKPAKIIAKLILAAAPIPFIDRAKEGATTQVNRIRCLRGSIEFPGLIGEQLESTH